MKSPRAKPVKSVKPKRQMTEEEKRRSVAVYPLSAGDDDMADAIPSWTQPKPKEGNWDEVVLPVVARKKGLEDQYEQADGSPQPKKIVKLVAPAPGTFGFKYRSPQDAEDIPMDEFGLQTEEVDEEDEEEEHQDPKPSQEPVSLERHDEKPPPVRHKPPPSPAPFADYLPPRAPVVSPVVSPVVPHPAQSNLNKLQSLRPEEDEDDGGCCKCVIM
jgi:serine/arginine repetitive matrix protein 1